MGLDKKAIATISNSAVTNSIVTYKIYSSY